MKRFGLLFALLSFIWLAFLSSAQAATEEPAKVEGTQDYIKEFEEMFKSPYQEEDYYRADRLLITATGSLKPVFKAPSVASVITANDIEEIGATTLDEVLETVPGLHVEPSGFGYFTPIWSIRGIHTEANPHVLMLINNVPFTMPYGGNRTNLYRMPISMISRVEVVRGPGSALHGADAYSGVVNVITKDNFEIDGTKMGVRVGSFETYDAWLQYGGQHWGWDLAMGIECQETAGDDDRIVEQDRLHFMGAAALSNAPGPLDTRYKLLDANLMARKGDFTLRLYGSVQESALGPGSVQAITYGSEMEQEHFLADLTYQNDHLLNDWDLTVRLNYLYKLDDTFVQFFPTDFLNMLGNPINESHVGGAETIGVYDGFTNHLVRLGAGFKHYDFEPDQYKNFGPAAGANQFGDLVHVTDPDHIYISSANRHLWYLLAQDEWSFARKWELTAGVRYDEYSDFGSTINPRAALVWETRPDLTTKLLYGQAFRAPSFAEQYVKNNPQVVGNENLKPEEIETLELAFDYQPTPEVRAILNLYTYTADELIDYIGTPPSAATNFAEIDGHGFEIELDWKVTDDFRLNSNFAYQRSDNKKTGARVHDAPGMQFYLNPHWTFLPDWSLGGQFYWIADRQRELGDPRDDIDDYGLINLILRRKNIAKHWDVALAVRNLLDEDARIPSPYDATAPAGAFIPNDYPREGRSVYGEVRYTF